MPDPSTGTVVELVLFLLFILYFVWDIVKCALVPDEEEETHQGAALEDSREVVTSQLAALRWEELPYFPYAAQGRESETLCPICMEPLQQGQHCSEVPACRHAFHRDCLGAWARSKGTCPLCRAIIVPGPVSNVAAAAAEDMV